MSTSVEAEHPTAAQLTARLRQEMATAKYNFDNWALAQEQAVSHTQEKYRQCMEGCTQAARELKAADERVRLAREAHERESQRQAEEVARGGEELGRLQERQQQELPPQLEELEAALAEQRAALAAVAAAAEARAAAARAELANITRAVRHYQHLGLQFERVSDGSDAAAAAGGGGDSDMCLRLVFTQIDAAAPARPFSFTVRVDATDAYAVVACAPPLPRAAVDGLVAQLNASNDFSTFVRAMRRGFVELARAGPCA